MNNSKILLGIGVVLLAFASFGFAPFGGISVGWLGLTLCFGSQLV